MLEIIFSFSYCVTPKLPHQKRWEVNSVGDEQQERESSHVQDFTANHWPLWFMAHLAPLARISWDAVFPPLSPLRLPILQTPPRSAEGNDSTTRFMRDSLPFASLFTEYIDSHQGAASIPGGFTKQQPIYWVSQRAGAQELVSCDRC